MGTSYGHCSGDRQGQPKDTTLGTVQGQLGDTTLGKDQKKPRDCHGTVWGDCSGDSLQTARDLPGTAWGEPREDPETVRIKGIEQLHPKNKLFETQDKSITLGAWLLCLLFLSNMQTGLKGLGHRESPDLLRGDPPPRPPTAARDEPQRLPPGVRPDSSAVVPKQDTRAQSSPQRAKTPRKGHDTWDCHGGIPRCLR